MKFNRRSFASTALAGLLAGCTTRVQGADTVRLQSRPGKTTGAKEPGVHALGLRKQRDSLLFVPKSASAETAAPLLVYLHGATGNEQQGIKRLSPFAEEFGFLLLSPASEDGTWDAIQGNYGADVRSIDRALARVFELRNVDAKRIGLCGFSDGASYGLGLGLSNGDLFSNVMAYSPGFIPGRPRPNGQPKIFISHGTHDQILPIDTCSRRLVPELKKAGYEITYREFEGPHTVPREITEESLKWFLG